MTDNNKENKEVNSDLFSIIEGNNELPAEFLKREDDLNIKGLSVQSSEY